MGERNLEDATLDEIDSEESSCMPNPCLNNGDCIENGKDYFCICANNFSGTNCQLGKKCVLP